MSSPYQLLVTNSSQADEVIHELDYRTHPLPCANMLYFEVPKAGCTTIKHLLHFAAMRHSNDEQSALQRLTTDPESVHDRGTSPLPKLSELEETLSESPLTNASTFRFSVVRDPTSRIMSAYLDKIISRCGYHRQLIWGTAGLPEGSSVSFEKFLEIIATMPSRTMDIHWRPQFDLLRPDIVNYDFIGRFEHFADALAEIMSHIPAHLRAPIPPPHRPTNASQRLHEFVTRRAADLINSIYATDFEAFAYPKCCAFTWASLLNAFQLGRGSRHNHLLAALGVWTTKHP